MFQRQNHSVLPDEAQSLPIAILPSPANMAARLYRYYRAEAVHIQRQIHQTLQVRQQCHHHYQTASNVHKAMQYLRLDVTRQQIPNLKWR
jgi:hypothetical protein